MEEKGNSEFESISRTGILPKTERESPNKEIDELMSYISENCGDINPEKIIEEARKNTDSILSEARKILKNNSDDTIKIGNLQFKVAKGDECLQLEAQSLLAILCIKYDENKKIMLNASVDIFGTGFHDKFLRIYNNNIVKARIYLEKQRLKYIELSMGLETFMAKVDDGKINFYSQNAEEHIKFIISEILNYSLKSNRTTVAELFADLLFVSQTPLDKRDNIYCLFGFFDEALASSKQLYEHLENNFFQHNKKDFVITRISRMGHAVAAVVFRDGRMMIFDSSNVFGSPINGITILEGFENTEIIGYELQNGPTCSYYSALSASLLACCDKEELEQIYKKSKEYREISQDCSQYIESIKNYQKFKKGRQLDQMTSKDITNKIRENQEKLKQVTQRYPAELLNFSIDIAKNAAILFDNLLDKKPTIRNVVRNIEYRENANRGKINYLNEFALRLLKMQPTEKDLFVDPVTFDIYEKKQKPAEAQESDTHRMGNTLSCKGGGKGRTSVRKGNGQRGGRFGQ